MKKLIITKDNRVTEISSKNLITRGVPADSHDSQTLNSIHEKSGLNNNSDNSIIRSDSGVASVSLVEANWDNEIRPSISHIIEDSSEEFIRPFTDQIQSENTTKDIFNEVLHYHDPESGASVWSIVGNPINGDILASDFRLHRLKDITKYNEIENYGIVFSNNKIFKLLYVEDVTSLSTNLVDGDNKVENLEEAKYSRSSNFDEWYNKIIAKEPLDSNSAIARLRKERFTTGLPYRLPYAYEVEDIIKSLKLLNLWDYDSFWTCTQMGDQFVGSSYKYVLGPRRIGKPQTRRKVNILDTFDYSDDLYVLAVLDLDFDEL